MPILFGTLTAIVMAIAAWTTYKNQTEFEKQISLRETQERNLARNLAEKKSREDELKREIDATNVLIAENKKLAIDLEKVNGEIADVESEIKQKQAKIQELKSKVEAAELALKDLGDIETLVPKIKRLNTEIAQLKDSIEKEEANLARLKQVKNSTQEEIAVKVGEAEKIAEGKSQTRLATTIKTVYNTWGFVTLNGGDIQGVVPDSILEVVRDDEVIAKLKVTTVEPNRAAADIVRDSVKTDLFLRSGDKVRAEQEEVKEQPEEGAKGGQPAVDAMDKQ